MKKFITKMLWAMQPFIIWVDKKFTIPHSIKKINGDHYYLWRDSINRGMVFLTNISGIGANLINPSEINHSAIYFGKGLRTAMLSIISTLEEIDSLASVEKANRIKYTLSKYGVNDDICYVLEAVGSGVIPTNLVKFMTTKDLLKCYSPLFATSKQMDEAAHNAIHDMGLPYDYGFSEKEDAKYCFELCGDAYENLDFSIKLTRKMFKLFGVELYETYTSETFQEIEQWKSVIDSEK